MQPTFEVFITGTERELRAQWQRLYSRIVSVLDHKCRENGIRFRHTILTPHNGRRLLHAAGPILCLAGTFPGGIRRRAGSRSGLRPTLTVAQTAATEDLLSMFAVAANTVYIYVQEQLKVSGGTGSDAAAAIGRLMQAVPAGRSRLRHGLGNEQELAKCVQHDLMQELSSHCNTIAPVPGDAVISAVHHAHALDYQEGYVPIPAYFERLDSWFESGLSQLAITGISGVGKTALLANWVPSFVPGDTDGPLVIRHFVELDGEGCDHSAIQHHILSELYARGLLSRTVPATSSEMDDALRSWMIEHHGNTALIVIDGLDQLSERSQHLRWLPSEYSQYCRMLVSTVSGSCAWETLGRRRWPTFELSVPNSELRDTIQGGSLSVVRPAVHELGEAASGEDDRDKHRDFDPEVGSQPDETMDAVLTLDLETLADHLLEQSPSPEGEALLCMLWGSRRGLSEHELCGIMGISRPQCRMIQRSVQYLLRHHGDRIALGHRTVRAAVERCLVGRMYTSEAIHRKLGEYFSNCDGERRAEEAPWQWARAGDGSELRAFIQDIATFDEMIAAGREAELLGYWRELGSNEEMAAAYRESMDTWLAGAGVLEAEASRVATVLERLGRFLSSCGTYAGAFHVLEQAHRIRLCYLPHDGIGLARLRSTMGETLRKDGRYDRAIELLSDADALSRSMEGIDGGIRAQIVSDLGLALHESGERGLRGQRDPLEYLREALRLKEPRLGANHPSTAETLNDMALVYHDRGHVRVAILLYEEALEIQFRSVRTFDHPAIATYLNNLAGAWRSAGRMATALTLYYQALDIRERTLRTSHPDTLITRTNIASLHHERGETDAVRDMCAGIRADAGMSFDADHPNYLAITMNVAQLLGAVGELHTALDLLNRTTGACYRTLGVSHKITAACVHNLARAYDRGGLWNEAVQHYGQAVRIWRRVLGDEHPQVETTLRFLADAFRALAQHDLAAAADAEADGVAARRLARDW